MHITVRERSPGTWRLRIETGRTKDGQRKFSYETLRGTADDAQRRRYELLNAHEQGSFSEPKKLLFGSYLDQWLKTRLALGKICRSTAETYQILINAYVKPDLGGTRLQRVGGADIQSLYTRLVAERGLKLSSVGVVHAILCGAFRGARKSRLITVNPMEEVDAPQGERPKPKALDQKKVATLLAGVRGDWKEKPILLAFMAGLRRGEVCGLRKADCHLDKGKISVEGQVVRYRDGTLEWKKPKSKRSGRTVHLPANAVALLREQIKATSELRMKLGLGAWKDTDYVFTLNGVDPINPEKLTREFAELRDALGLEGSTFHSTRHTHVTALLQKVGKSGAKAVSERVGHASVAFTLDKYQTVFEEDRDALADLAGGIIGE
jgi:integrase